jgi:hypothetical protein
VASRPHHGAARRAEGHHPSPPPLPGASARAARTEIATAARHAHTGTEAGGHVHAGGPDQAAMIADFRRRFGVSLALTVPILALSPMIQHALGLREALEFPGSDYVLFLLASVVFLYGGWPFLAGMAAEVRSGRPGMMTLVALATSVAYLYSGAVVLGLGGEPFFWELATLIAVMLLGHWIEMRSVMGASGALEALVRLLPATATRFTPGGGTEEVPVAALRPGDRVLAAARRRRGPWLGPGALARGRGGADVAQHDHRRDQREAAGARAAARAGGRDRPGGVMPAASVADRCRGRARCGPEAQPASPAPLRAARPSAAAMPGRCSGKVPWNTRSPISVTGATRTPVRRFASSATAGSVRSCST